MKILFMGSSDISQESLEKIYDKGFEICGVVTNTDKPAGRGKKIFVNPVKIFANEKSLPVFQPEKLRKNIEFENEIKKINPDLTVVVSYGKILPKSFLEIPKFGTINLHPSMLPKYRGPAPIQWAVLNGDKKTGVSIMYLDEGMDSGDIIEQKEVDIGDDETTGELWERLSSLGADLLVKVIEDIENGNIVRKKQSSNYTLAPLIEKEMSRIAWENLSSKEVKNLVRGLNPFMGAYTNYDEKKIKLWKVQALSFDEYNEKYESIDHNVLKNGEIVKANSKEGLFIKVCDGIISVLEIQGENAKKMSIFDYLRGNKILENKVLE